MNEENTLIELDTDIVKQTLIDAEKLELGQAIKAVFDNIALNLQALEIPESSFFAWKNMPKLIRFLPELPSEPSNVPNESATEV